MKTRMTDSYLFKCIMLVIACFVLDSTISYFLPYNYTKVGMTIVPCLGLMMFSMLVRTVDGAERYLFAAICSVYYSIVYSNSLAIYILIYCLIAFVRSDNICARMRGILADVDYQYDKISYCFILNNEDVTYFNS